jgi:hypothetical protein
MTVRVLALPDEHDLISSCAEDRVAVLVHPGRWSSEMRVFRAAPDKSDWNTPLPTVHSDPNQAPPDGAGIPRLSAAKRQGRQACSERGSLQ